MKIKLKKPSYDERLLKLTAQKNLDGAVQKLNQRHFTVRVGNKNVVADYRPRQEAERGVILFTTEEFNKRYKAYHFRNPINDRLKELGPLWLSSPSRRHYDGTLVFKPTGVRRPPLPSDYNQWRGFAVEPKPGKWDLFQRHLRENVCSGNQDWFKYLLDYLADMVQRPGRLPGVAIVLYGEEGVGKTCVYEFVKRMFHPTDTVLVAGSTDLTASFNTHLANKVWVCADEAFFAGDPRMVGQLQHMITGEEWLLHPKGIDRYKVDNCMHLLIVSNHEWVVRASKEARRYFVLEVGTGKQRDFAFFDAITRQMDCGGTAAMLHDLQQRPLASFNPMNFPTTPFLHVQKEHSRAMHEQWHLEELSESSSDSWQDFMRDKKRVHTRYIEWVKVQNPHGRRLSLEGLSKYFINLYGRAVVGRLRQGGIQKKVYLFPSLGESRSRFDAVRWPHKDKD